MAKQKVKTGKKVRAYKETLALSGNTAFNWRPSKHKAHAKPEKQTSNSVGLTIMSDDRRKKIEDFLASGLNISPSEDIELVLRTQQAALQALRQVEPRTPVETAILASLQSHSALLSLHTVLFNLVLQSLQKTE